MSESEDLDRICGDVIKYGLLHAERTETLVSDFSGDGVEQALIDKASTVANNADDPNREKKVWLLMANLGSNLGSDKVSSAGQQGLNQWKEIHGGQ